ncbi:diacylglycerol/lipid kinase family protein [Sphingomonas sp. ERG5]|uniref:diacylglycerol/lipid kinase family protein n=1 Tax=Sphingomonas sp. ERG5 TaxID=1381597 RepID=UPI00054C0DCC|nr:diacylglycerol kinase family protein [Sphingomonas sp. ERG5]
MKNLWFITNPSSGSATPEKCTAIEAVFAECGLSLVGRTGFPDAALPTPQSLDAAKVDTVVLFAGDGTINAAVCALADWDGAILLLPGGTMNLLAKALHGNADPAAIIHAAHEGGEKIALPFVEAGTRRALVGLILGPAASWVRAREMVRAGKMRGLGRAMLMAWRRTFSHGIKLEGVRGLRERAQAVFVRPEADHLDVAAVDARDFSSIAALGWEWLTGDWVAAAAVTQVRATVIRVAGRKPALALFDGEPVMLEPGIPITGGMTERQFLKTVDAL